MSNIPTAEELLKARVYITTDDVESVHDSVENVKDAMIEFAKLHVEAALKAAAENAEIDDIGSPNPDGEWVSWNSINKHSILNAYPLNNII